MSNPYDRYGNHPDPQDANAIDPQILLNDYLLHDFIADTTNPSNFDQFDPYLDALFDFDAFFTQGEVTQQDENLTYQNAATMPHNATTVLDQPASTYDTPSTIESVDSSRRSGRRRVFSDEQRNIIQRFSDKVPSVVMEMLKAQDPIMQQTYKQVKGAVETARRKEKKRKIREARKAQTEDAAPTQRDQGSTEERNTQQQNLWWRGGDAQMPVRTAQHDADQALAGAGNTRKDTQSCTDSMQTPLNSFDRG